ncbi:MAG: acetyl-CoA carboxylase biotin carboxyl carrier protein [Panacagrimonas sp.]
MALSEKEILQVLDMFQKSGWEGMQLESGSVKLSISKTGRPQLATRAATAPAAAPAPASVAVAAPAAVLPPAAPMIDPRWISVKAPLLGHFYASPKPGAPPFVALGQQVAADETVAILEVMKLMNHVKAGVAGRIARIAVANGDLVEFDQAILYIDPSHG